MSRSRTYKLNYRRKNEMSSTVHFELPADDIQRAKKFYFSCLAGGLKLLKAWIIC
jgi:hypothetical protein